MKCKINLKAEASNIIVTVVIRTHEDGHQSNCLFYCSFDKRECILPPYLCKVFHLNYCSSWWEILLFEQKITKWSCEKTYDKTQ